MTKRVLFAAILCAMGMGCSEKKDTPIQLWQWDDVQKHWLYEGETFTPASTQASPAVWKKQDNAISMSVESPAALTAFDNAPKALQLKVFQLRDASAFLQATTAKGGLKQLLMTEAADPTLVKVERFIVLPGETQTLSFARQEGARYLGVILGYASDSPEKFSRLIPIVTVDEAHPKEKIPGVLPFLSALFKSKDSANSVEQPVALKLKLSLEATEINQLAIEVK